MKNQSLILCVLILAGCSSHTPKQVISPQQIPQSKAPPRDVGGSWSVLTKHAGRRYGVDRRLIEAIIDVESKGNPLAVSRSGAVGLMQVKSSTAGREVYRFRRQRGQPGTNQLKDPAQNIDIGTAYLQLLQSQQLAGIRNPETLRYATIVSYANGSGTLLRTFSRNRGRAIKMINALTPQEFYQHVRKKHPAAQAPRYLNKVTRVYRSI